MSSSTLAYITRRVLWAVPTLLLVAVLVFVMLRLIPGDPAIVVLGDDGTPQQIADLRAQYGLDKPIVTQFLLWLSHVVRGDLGHSITSGQEVLPLLIERFEVSASIVLAAVLAATVVAVPAGLYAAWKQGTPADTGIVIAATLFLSIPSFWLGLMLLLVVGIKLGWVPIVGYVPLGVDWRAAIAFLILPIVTLALIETGVLMRMSRASAIETLRLEYVTHARAKGLTERRVLLRHVLPNAFGPTLTMVGLVLGHLLGGIAVLETVFTLPGLGRLLVDSIFARDYPVVQGCMLFTAVVYVFVNLVIDLCYPFFDPRVGATR
jgi:peptide/nickel transport system permease protein